MHLVTWMAATLFIAASAAGFTRSLRLPGRWDQVLAWMLLVVTGVVVAVWTAGVVFASLTVETVLALAAGMASLAAAFAFQRRLGAGRRAASLDGADGSGPSPGAGATPVPWRAREWRLDGVALAAGTLLGAVWLLAAFVAWLLPPYAYDELA
ncbi:MAG: hypothetical protein IRZ33_05560 [Alicyclobacillaceae bacterium]|nr:hypothetical protein [Alicyclobacillaceae bacterium]